MRAGAASAGRSAGSAARSTAAKSWAASLPQASARRLVSAARPFSSIARWSAPRPTGSRPSWSAYPSRNRFAAIASPKSAVASSVAGSSRQPSSPALRRIASSIAPAERSRSGCEAKSAVGATWSFTIARLRPFASFESTSAPAVTTMSQPSTRSAAPAPIRVAKSAAGSFAIRTWLVTGPFF